MPIAVTFAGKPSVGRRWQARVVVSGVPGDAAHPDLVLWLGARADATPPVVPDDLTLGKAGANITMPLFRTVKTLVRDAAAAGRWTITQVLEPGDVPGLVAGARVYYAVSESEDPTDELDAVSAPLRATY